MKWCVVFAAVLVPLTASGLDPDERAIEMAKVGALRVAMASWWGFDPQDATASLQAAIDSGVSTLVVDNPGGPWFVRPIALTGNQTIVFQPGVEVVAKPGEFAGVGDCLFTARNLRNLSLIGYGAALRMQRDDYADSARYTKGEWRHALAILGCQEVNVYGLTLAESGGDGIYLGKSPDGAANAGIHIKDVLCDRNYRQGISVITATNLLIERTTMRDTRGTPPEAGIDFEPNGPDERLVNIVMRDCLTERNNGDGYQVAVFHLHESSEPLSIRIENCRSVGDMRGARVCASNMPGKVVTGSVEFAGCVFERSVEAGFILWNKPDGGFDTRFTDCEFLDPAPEQPDATPLLLLSGSETSEPLGGVAFANCRMRDPIERELLSYDTDGAPRLPVEGITGGLLLERGGAVEEIAFTPERVAACTAMREPE